MAYSTIPKGNLYMDTVLYTGNGSTQNITGVGFKPDWVWVKQRGGTTNHKTSDIVRGVTKALQPNDSDAEATDSNGITAFNSDGFSLGAGGDYNGSSNTQVAWNWLAGGAGSANTDGSISSTVSVNTTARFSIVKWTGTDANATVGHGLGVVPKMIMFKTVGLDENWIVYNSLLGNTKYLRLNTTDAESNASSTMFNSTSPTATTISVGANSANKATTMIAYCFAEVQGYSKFGSYTGNGNADGPFLYTGFTPAWLMLKRTDGTNSWRMWDNKRDPFNVRDTSINANESGAEYTDASVYMDFVSNGVKFRTTGDNISGANYIYMAFASNPFVATSGSDAIPVTAI